MDSEKINKGVPGLHHDVPTWTYLHTALQSHNNVEITTLQVSIMGIMEIK